MPKVALMSRREAIRTLGERESKSLVAVHQIFEGDITGRALLIFPEERSLELVRAVVGSELSLEEIIELEQEALAETGNIILNSCLATIANTLESNLKISLPGSPARRELEVLQPGAAAGGRHHRDVHLYQLRHAEARHQRLHRDDDGHAVARRIADAAARVDPADRRSVRRRTAMPETAPGTLDSRRHCRRIDRARHRPDDRPLERVDGLRQPPSRGGCRRQDADAGFSRRRRWTSSTGPSSPPSTPARRRS